MAVEPKHRAQEPDTTSLAASVARLAETVSACERLCLLSARSLTHFVFPGNAVKRAAPLNFFTSVTWDHRNADASLRHPTTSAQCVTALQRLLPVVGRFRLGTRESKDLAFYSVDRNALKLLEPGRLGIRIRKTIECALRALQDEDSGPKSASTVPEALKSDTFEPLHPFVCAQVLRAIAPSSGAFNRTWWQALFSALWFLNRRKDSLAGYPNMRSTSAPGTAFLTAKCVDAIDIAYTVLVRRRERFRRFAALLQELIDCTERRSRIETLLTDELIDKTNFTKGFGYKQRCLEAEIKDVIQAMSADSRLNELYREWWSAVSASPTSDQPFVERVIGGFCGAVRSTKDKIDPIRQQSKEAFATLEKITNAVSVVCNSLSREGKPRRHAASLSIIPQWTCSESLRAATKKALRSRDPERDEALQALARHWERHRTAATAALDTAKAFDTYLDAVLRTFDKAVNEWLEDKSEARHRKFLASFSKASDHFPPLQQRVERGIESGVRWAEIVMNRQLTYASAGATTQFDPSELANAARVVCQWDRHVGFDTVLGALEAVCRAQRPDGSWPCQQPFYWDDTGNASYTLSVEVAHAIVRTVNDVLSRPERFGASLDEVSDGLAPIFESLDRFFRWLSASIQSFDLPPGLKVDQSELTAVFGWCSDRAYEPGRLHSWVTANTIEFLVDYRQLLQEQTNTLIRTSFISHNPTELKPLAEVEPTDLATEDPVAWRLLQHLRGHKALGLTEGPWLPFEPAKPDPAVSFWSGILYGPPGTSKSFLAKAIAGELKWPLISLSPADFLTGGESHVEARAKEIFSALSSGSKLVYFFDEVDELIRERRQINEGATRNVFSFLTPSFLTKLQDFREAAQRNEFIFIIGTNYFERIDPAAKRSGRIDDNFMIVYQDLPSRSQKILNDIVKKISQESDRDPVDVLSERLDTLHKLSKDKFNGARFLDEYSIHTGMFSYTTIDRLDERLLFLTDNLKKASGMEAFIAELQRARHGRSDRFKPEIELVYYGDRPDAEEEIARVAAVLPNADFPWDGSKSTGYRLGRKIQLDRLGDEFAKKINGDAANDIIKRILERIGRIPSD
jgi:hypothetical protein